MIAPIEAELHSGSGSYYGSYGASELRFAAPVADALATSASFRSWLLARTVFRRFSHGAMLLDKEMKAQRSAQAATWWRSHWRGGCQCAGCAGGQETDLLAVFSEPEGKRFALHIEVKQPKDSFPATKDQAGNYAVRAKCWATAAPAAVLRHDMASTMLLCSASKLSAYEPHLGKFGSVVTFEQIASDFPFLYAAEQHGTEQTF